ncbi:MAG: UvrD-helicase domain-containing protein, partial [Phycisphaerae bacterium]
VEYRDVAVLFARMTHSLEYERQLQRRGIPYYVVAGTGFFQQQEVYDLLGALSVVDNPLDDVSFMGLLRSAMVGLDDNALAAIALCGEAPYLPAMIENLRRGEAATTVQLRGDDANRLHDTADLIGRLHRRKNALGIAEVLERLLEHTGYEGVLLGRFQGRRPMGNVRRVVEFARQADADGLSLADFVARMREQVLSEQRFEQAAVAGEEENVVRLMTIHQAKGLEFPVVMLPDLNAGRQRRGDRLLHRDDWGLTGQYTLLDDQDAPAPLVHRLALRSEDADQVAEDIRRFYVAVTRHEDHLVLVGADWRDKAGAVQPADCTLRTLDDLLGISAALERGEQTIRYGDGRYTAAVARAAATQEPPRRREVPPGEKMMADDPGADELARRILASAGTPPDQELPLLGPLPDHVGRAEVAVTALTEFTACPAMYRYRYELRMPEQWEDSTSLSRPADRKEPDADHGGSMPPLDPLALGTLLHRCMELLDFTQPQDAGMLLESAILDTGLEEVPLQDVLPTWGAMLERFCASPLRERLAEAKETCRELDFVMDVDGVCLRGQIDLLWQDAAGQWRVLDYKTDRLGEEETPADRGGKYALQLEAYAMAAERFLGEPVAAAELLFLRSGQTWGLDAGRLAGGEGRRLEEAGRDLLRARRAGKFPPRRGDRCSRCPFGWLCA